MTSLGQNEATLFCTDNSFKINVELENKIRFDEGRYAERNEKRWKYTGRNDRMNECMNERINELIDEWMNWIDEWVNQSKFHPKLSKSSLE